MRHRHTPLNRQREKKNRIKERVRRYRQRGEERGHGGRVGREWQAGDGARSGQLTAAEGSLPTWQLGPGPDGGPQHGVVAAGHLAVSAEPRPLCLT